MSSLNPVWSKLKYFKPDSKSDNWGDPAKINTNLLLNLDAYRAAIGIPVVVTSGTGGTHEPNSQHYLGNAADIQFPTMKQPLFELYLMAERFHFTGIGIYPHWQYNGYKIGGLHVDIRPLGVNEPAHRWLGVSQNGKQEYIAFSYQNLKTYGLLG